MPAPAHHPFAKILTARLAASRSAPIATLHPQRNRAKNRPRPRGRPPQDREERDDGNRRRKRLDGRQNSSKQGLAATSTREIAAAAGMHMARHLSLRNKGVALRRDERGRTMATQSQQQDSMRCPPSHSREQRTHSFATTSKSAGPCSTSPLCCMNGAATPRSAGHCGSKESYEAAWWPALEALAQHARCSRAWSGAEVIFGE